MSLTGLAPSNADAARLAGDIGKAIAPILLEPQFAFVADERALHTAREDLAALSKRLQALDSSLNTLAGQSDLQAVAALIPELRAGVQALSGRLDHAAAQSEVEDLRRRLDDPVLRLAQRVEVDAVFFDVGTSILNKATADRLVADVAPLALDAGADLRIVGYTDVLGTLESNRVLARQRAQIVADMLVAAGVPRERLILVARPDGPRISDLTLGDGQSDRRVDIEIAYRDERSFGGGRRP